MLAEVGAQVEADCPGSHCGGCGCHSHCCGCHNHCDSDTDDPIDPCDCTDQIKTCDPIQQVPFVPDHDDFIGILELFDANNDKCMQICEFKHYYDNYYTVNGSIYGALDDVHMCEWFGQYIDAF